MYAALMSLHAVYTSLCCAAHNRRSSTDTAVDQARGVNKLNTDFLIYVTNEEAPERTYTKILLLVRC
jgi:hypothetical protein